MDTGGEKERQKSLVVTSSVLTALATIVVGLRVVTRQRILRNVGKDDWFMLAAWFFTVVYLIEICLTSRFGIGLKSSELSLDQTISLMKLTLAIEINYYVLVYCIKVSILYFYLRIAAEHTFQLLCQITIGILSVFVAICVIVCLGQCRPLVKLWDFIGAIDGQCINTTALFYSTSAFNIVTDIWIICLPIKTLRGIQRPRNEKIALFVIFGIGVFACIASIVRLHTIYLFTLSADPFHDGIPVNLWSMIEVSTAIVCASVPALKPIVSKRQRERTARYRGASGYPGSGSGSGSGTLGGSQMFGKGSLKAKSSLSKISFPSLVSGKRARSNKSDVFDSLSSTTSQSHTQTQGTALQPIAAPSPASRDQFYPDNNNNGGIIVKHSLEQINARTSESGSEERILYPSRDDGVNAPADSYDRGESGLGYDKPRYPGRTLDRFDLPVQSPGHERSGSKGGITARERERMRIGDGEMRRLEQMARREWR